jgi:hypothetical protein
MRKDADAETAERSTQEAILTIWRASRMRTAGQKIHQTLQSPE